LVSDAHVADLLLLAHGDEVHALERDEVMLEALGPAGGEFLRLKHMEWIEYMRHVSDWEQKTYLEFF
ncbi:MAG: hypothetical protein ACN6QC_27205, partial [Paraburkholderia hospita]